MKKKLLVLIVVAAIAIVAGWNYNHNKNVARMSELGLANIEALAGGEGSDEKLYELHCGSRPGTQCQSVLTGPSCSTKSSCP